MTPAWVVPTVRAVPWQPLAGVAAALALLTGVCAYSGQWPTALAGVGAAALAAALVAGLHDPAAALLSAVPTSPATRRTRRHVLLLAAGLVVWAAYAGAAHLLAPSATWSFPTVLALTATGFAVAVWAPGSGLEAGVAAPLLWYAATRASDGTELPQVLTLWQHQPWIVTAAAVAALWMGRDR